ncbi:hypothetical protein Hanom_Chr09g00835461 [Helianthus anomalus]
MSSNSSSPSIRSQNPKIFRLGTDGNVYCNHELLAIRRVAGNRSSRQGACKSLNLVGNLISSLSRTLTTSF